MTFLDKQVLWNNIISLVSIWYKAHDLLEEFSLKYVERFENFASLVLFFLFVSFCNFSRRICCPPISLYSSLHCRVSVVGLLFQSNLLIQIVGWVV